MQESTELSPAMRKMLDAAGRACPAHTRQRGLEFQPSSEDVVISTASKSGTTWVQQICHGLRSGGDMSFDEISLVVPCIEMAYDYKYEDLDAAQPFAPRMYKTHLWYNHCPKGAGKYVTVVRSAVCGESSARDCGCRHPVDVAISFYHFFEDWYFPVGAISIEEFVEDFLLRRGKPASGLDEASQIHHIWSWYPHRNDENVLWLHFDDLKQDLRRCVRLIADFLDIGSGDDALQELVTHQASFEFMKKHSTKFDEHQLKLATNELAGLPRDAGMQGNAGKVRTGGDKNARQVLSPRIVAKIEQRWKAVMEQDTGYATYEAMREGINKELKRQFG